ncbi:asparagine synthase (glutamine-hydrolyzing) [Candidatus Marinamargulisbacteria bacterium SCGC AG-410-N11]|nr:asparagine synthase (glutamine-hydrolyzing) [Candidatus Marinamargulisbacteria bacterium SCGC AG-410-N11]
MCGVVGVVDQKGNQVKPAVIEAMINNIRHRGPDNQEVIIDKNIGIAHCRLSIIDLSDLANQPMVSQNKRFIISYNGEVYNFKQIRSELQRLGRRFISNSDAEVVLQSYEEWGIRCLTKFNGMFAFIIWDKQNNQFFIARDRYGIKPLYYATFDNVFMVASEQKAFAKHPKFKSELDYEALLEYFTFQNIFTNKTFNTRIKLFPPGHYGVISTINKQSSLQLTQYWDFHFEEPSDPASEAEYIEELDRLFKQAVERQMVSDVEIGSYLSGGMDSGAITALAAKQNPYIKTFTCGFDLNSAQGLELGFDEREKAEYMSYLFQTEHYEIVLKAGDMERCLSQLAYHLEEPRVGQCYPNFYASKLASKFVKVVLSGAGGDELFGGYPWRYYRAVVNDDFEHYIDKYYIFWQRLISNKDIKKVFSPVWDKVGHVWTRDIFRDVFKTHAEQFTRPEDYVNHSLYFEAKTFLQGLLIVEDKMSMAHSLETRVPFLDNDLVDFAMKLPVKLKLGNLSKVVRINENEPGSKTKKYFNKTKDGKLILRKAMQAYIPESVTKIEKQGFSAPDQSWFKKDSYKFIEKLLLDKNSKIYDVFDYESIKSLVDSHLAGEENRRLLIWGLLNVNEILNNTFILLNEKKMVANYD